MSDSDGIFFTDAGVVARVTIRTALEQHEATTAQLVAKLYRMRDEALLLAHQTERLIAELEDLRE